jgi:hypothetical protein
MKEKSHQWKLMETTKTIIRSNSIPTRTQTTYQIIFLISHIKYLPIRFIVYQSSSSAKDRHGWGE